MTAAADTPECVKEVRSGKIRLHKWGGFSLGITSKSGDVEDRNQLRLSKPNKLLEGYFLGWRLNR